MPCSATFRLERLVASQDPSDFGSVLKTVQISADARVFGYGVVLEAETPDETTCACARIYCITPSAPTGGRSAACSEALQSSSHQCRTAAIE